MAADFPDLHHKLCKKLAHLITGFYHLNTKSDETDLIVRNTVESYEDELDKIIISANVIIEKTIKESAQGVDLLEIRDTYRVFKDKLEQERASAVKEFNVFKENMMEKEKGVKASADKQVHMYKDEVEGLKAKLWHMQKLVEKVYGSEIKFDQDELKAKEAEHLQVKAELEERNKELDELKNRYQDIERAYKELEELHAFSDKMTTNWSRDLMDNGEGLEWENELMRKKITEQERIIFALRKVIGQENGFYDGDDAASIEYGGSSNRETDLQKEWMNSQRIIKEKEIEIEKLKGRLGDERLQLKIEEYENRLKEAGREHRKLIETLHTEYSENMAEMEAQMEKDRIRWEAIIQGMNTTLDSRNEYIAGLEEKLKSLEEMQEKMNEEAQKSSRSQQNETALNQEIVRLNQLLADAKKQSERDLNAERQKAQDEQEHLKEEFKLEKEKSLIELKEQLSKNKSLSDLQKEKILELEAEVFRLQDVPTEKLEQRAREMAEEYQNKVNELSRRHNLTSRELIEKHDEKVNQINKSYETQLEEIRNELRREKELVLKMKDEDKHNEIQNVKKEYEITLQRISKSYDLQLEEKVNEYEATIKTKDFEALELRKEVEKIKDILKNEMNKSDEKFQNYKELEKTVKEQNDAIESLQEELHHRQIEGEGEGAGSSYLAELKKLKEGVYIDEDKDKIIREHLKYAKNMEKKFIDLKKQCEERIQMLIEKYNELVDIFEMRPSRSEDLALIRQLQEEGLGREEEVRRLSEKLKPSHSTENLRRDESKISFSQPATNAIASTITSDKIKKTSIKNNAPGISPSNATTILPPISVSQFSIHMRSPPASNGLMTSKKFFK